MKKLGKNNKIIVILGPTAGGKTGLGIKLALKYNGEIVSADSRQVYRYMDIGTGKDLSEYNIKIPRKGAIYRVPYHLIDIVRPNTKYDLAKYKRDAIKAIDDVLKRGKLPIVVGGTGLYLQALVDDYQMSDVKPNKELRKKLEKLNAEQLFKKLAKLNKKFAVKLNQSERGNKRRLIRFIEIERSAVLQCGGSDIAAPWRAAICGKGAKYCASTNKYDFLLIGVKYPKEIIWDRIYKRLIERLEKENMVEEVRGLHEKHKVSRKRLIGFGLEYKFISEYLVGKYSYEEMVEKLFVAIRQFAKRQMTWFRRWEKQGARINWIKSKKEAEILIKNFLKK